LLPSPTPAVILVIFYFCRYTFPEGLISPHET
jgi:hypothetical protein